MMDLLDEFSTICLKNTLNSGFEVVLLSELMLQSDQSLPLEEIFHVVQRN